MLFWGMEICKLQNWSCEILEWTVLLISRIHILIKETLVVKTKPLFWLLFFLIYIYTTLINTYKQLLLNTVNVSLRDADTL